ncbi:MAG: hypothetical protein V3S83_03815 [Gemmatimonadota bacterium]
MWWIAALIAGLSGAVAVLLATPFRRWGNVGYMVAMAALFLLIRLGADQTIRPPLVNWYAEKELAKDPLYKHIFDEYPELREPILTAIIHVANGGSMDSKGLSALYHVLAPALQALIGKAPPEHIVRFMEVTAAAAKELQRQDAELCFKFLYPAPRGGIDSTRYLDPGTQDEMMKMLNEGAEAAVLHPHRFDGDLDELMERHVAIDQFTQEELLAVAAPNENTDAALACGASIRILDQILKAPEPDRAELFRGLLTEG